MLFCYRHIPGNMISAKKQVVYLQLSVAQTVVPESQQT